MSAAAPVLKLWLLRHAALPVPPGLCYGATDLPADEERTRQAAAAAAAALPHGAPLWCADLRRARQLARDLHRLRPDLPLPRPDPRLDEMNFGCWELQPWSAIPREAFDAWTADFAHHRFGGVESTQMVIDRVADALAGCAAEVGPRGQAIWVTHAGVIRALHFLASGQGPVIRDAMQWPKEAPPPGGWCVLEIGVPPSAAGR